MNNPVSSLPDEQRKNTTYENKLYETRVKGDQNASLALSKLMQTPVRVMVMDIATGTLWYSENGGVEKAL